MSVDPDIVFQHANVFARIVGEELKFFPDNMIVDANRAFN